MSGKIYKLTLKDESFYYGSTFYEIKDRMSYHKTHSRLNYTRKLYKRINELGGWEDVKCEIVEDNLNISEKELRQKENEHIKLHIKHPLCLNRNRVFISDDEKLEYFKQYKIINADEIKLKEVLRNKTEKRIAYKKEYTEEHREDLLMRNKEYIKLHAEELQEKRKQRYNQNREQILENIRVKTLCECGGIFRKRDVRRHERSVKHQEWLNTKEK